MNQFSTSLLRSTLIVVSISILAIACKKDNLIRPGDPLPDAYKKALRLYENEEYGDAANAFETVLSIGRGTEYGRNAQYYLAETYYKDKRYLLAASEYARFVSLYPQSERREEVEFKEALCYYNMSPRYRLDQKYTRRALDRFRLFQSRYPDSERLPKVAEYINELRSKLARKLYHAADSYMRWDQYEAATIYYEMTIDQYPETDWAEQALVNLINAYVVYADHSVREKQAQRYKKAIENYEKYLQLYPSGEYRSKAETFVDKARVALNKLDTAATASSGSTN